MPSAGPEPTPFVDFPAGIPFADIPRTECADRWNREDSRALPADSDPVRSTACAQTTTHLASTGTGSTGTGSSGTGRVGLALSAGVAYAWIGFQLILALTVAVARLTSDGPAFAIESGSMRPTVPVGAVVVTKSVDYSEIQPADIVSFVDPTNPDRVVTHRVVDTVGGAVTTKGDANAQPDSTPVAPQAVLGRAFLVIPGAAKPVVWIQHGDVVPLALWLLSWFVAAALIQAERRSHWGQPRPTHQTIRPYSGTNTPSPARHAHHDAVWV